MTNFATTSAADALTKAEMQSASFFPVDISGGAVAITLEEALESGDIGRKLIFAVTTGHATEVMTVASGANVTVVEIDSDPAKTGCDDAGDFIECLITATGNATCITYAND